MARSRRPSTGGTAKLGLVTALVLVVMLAAGSAGAQLACGSLPSNYNQAFHARDAGFPGSGKNITGVRGNQNVRTTPAVPLGIQQVHPVQIYGTTADFVAIGTGRGAAPTSSSPLNRCTSQYGSTWDVYSDGRINNEYFCETLLVAEHQTGDSPSFEIRPTTCFGVDAWGLYWKKSSSGVPILRHCADSAIGAARFASVGLEVIRPPGSTASLLRNIDVRHANLEVRVYTYSSAVISYETFGNAAAQGGSHVSCASTGYEVDAPNVTTRRAFLPPWD